jgi:hypothetical protein
MSSFLEPVIDGNYHGRLDLCRDPEITKSLVVNSATPLLPAVGGGF